MPNIKLHKDAFTFWFLKGTVKVTGRAESQRLWSTNCDTEVFSSANVLLLYRGDPVETSYLEGRDTVGEEPNFALSFKDDM